MMATTTRFSRLGHGWVQVQTVGVALEHEYRSQ